MTPCFFFVALIILPVSKFRHIFVPEDCTLGASPRIILGIFSLTGNSLTCLARWMELRHCIGDSETRVSARPFFCERVANGRLFGYLNRPSDFFRCTCLYLVPNAFVYPLLANFVESLLVSCQVNGKLETFGRIIRVCIVVFTSPLHVQFGLPQTYPVTSLTS